ncbi:hypothetical protein [Candidatus Nitrotoga arctica]|nr:hypothetical protein [Candidatus Nitrotoga arctica]
MPYIQAIGGELDLVARFPHRPPILLDHIAQASTKPIGASSKAIA